jgi:hypothetical protein
VVIERAGYGIAAVLTVVSGVLWGGAAMVATAAGGAVACLNLWLMRRMVEQAQREAAEGDREGASRRLLARFALKTPAIAALIYFAIVRLRLEPGPFALGLTSLVLAVVGGALWVVARRRW